MTDSYLISILGPSSEADFPLFPGYHDIYDELVDLFLTRSRNVKSHIGYILTECNWSDRSLYEVAIRLLKSSDVDAIDFAFTISESIFLTSKQYVTCALDSINARICGENLLLFSVMLFSVTAKVPFCNFDEFGDSFATSQELTAFVKNKIDTNSHAGKIIDNTLKISNALESLYLDNESANMLELLSYMMSVSLARHIDYVETSHPELLQSQLSTITSQMMHCSYRIEKKTSKKGDLHLGD